LSLRRRVQLEPAFLLHHRPYRDSSRILDLFMRDHGRVHLFARGVRGAGRGLGAVLQPFQALLVSWSGSAEGGTLSAAELDAGSATAALPPERLLAAFYLNELLLRLLPPDDAHPELFESYGTALGELAGGADEARALRLFEKRLLDTLGLGLDYARVAGSGAAVEPDAYYHVRAERGVLGPLPSAERADALSGADLLALAGETLESPSSVTAARRALKAALESALDGRVLASRDVARAVRAAQQRPGRGHDERK
jgi:DNA repair protein RecO (recombination protein O)